MHQCGRGVARNADPAIEGSRLPHPSDSWDEHPITVVVRHPSPGIGGGEHVAEPWIEAPSAVRERIPADARKEGLPHHAVAGYVTKRAIVIQVAESVSVGGGVIPGVLIVVGSC